MTQVESPPSPASAEAAETRPPPKNGAELILRCLELQGVDHIWGYPGGAIMPVYDAFVESPITHLLTRHEQGAAFAAQGHARTTQTVGVCMATSGPGATNLVTGIADALLDSVPIVAITGQVPIPMIGTDAFQETDVVGVMLPITKHAELVESVAEIPRAIRDAFRTAATGRPGPVVIDIPKDVQTAAVPEGVVPLPPECEDDLHPDRAAAHVRVPASEVDVALDRAMELLRKAQRPLLYAGGGVAMGRGTDALRTFAEYTGIPLVHTLKGLGGLPGGHPQFLGMLGMHGHACANTAVQTSDTLIAVGVRFDDRATGRLSHFAPGASVIHIDIDPSEVGKLRRPTASVPGDCARIVPRLQKLVEPEIHGMRIAWSDWVVSCHANKAVDPTWLEGEMQEGHPVTAPALLRRLSQLAGEEAIVCCDVGQHQMWVAQHWQFQRPDRHLTSAGLGTMGFGLPAAMGAQRSNPGCPTICISGDGSIMMNIQELVTLKRFDLPVKVVVLDNSVLGMVRQQQEIIFQNRESEVSLHDNPDFAALARVMGIRGVTLSEEAWRSPGGLDEALLGFLREPGPCLMHARIDRGANVYPFVPGGKSNDQMILAPAGAVGYSPPRPADLAGASARSEAAP